MKSDDKGKAEKPSRLRGDLAKKDESKGSSRLRGDLAKKK